MADNKVWKSVKPFFNGGASGMMATVIIQPIDMVKVRIQLGAAGSPVSTAQQQRALRLGRAACFFQALPHSIANLP